MAIELTVVFAVLAATTIGLVGLTLLRRSSKVEDATRHLAEAVRDIGRYPEVSLAEKKRKAILALGPKTFYYIDENQVRDLYTQVFQELKPKRIKTRETEETKKGITAKIKFLEPKYEKGRGKEVTKSYEVEQTLATMYNEIEQYLVENDKVTFGLEEFEYDKSSIAEFQAMCEHMESKLNFSVPEELQSKFLSDKMTDFAVQNLEKLSHVSGYVAVQGELSVVDISKDGYTLSLTHPLSQHLAPGVYDTTIQVTCTSDCVTPSGKSTFKRDKLIKITCLGKVVSWRTQDAALEIGPIAIY